MLNYLNNSKIERVTNENIARLHHYVSSVRDSAEVQSDYMTLGEWIDWNVEELTEARVEAKVAAKVAEVRESSRAEGRAEGRISVLLENLEELGTVPGEIQKRIPDIDEETLKRWTKLAVKAESMEEFLEQIQGTVQ